MQAACRACRKQGALVFQIALAHIAQRPTQEVSSPAVAQLFALSRSGCTGAGQFVFTIVLQMTSGCGASQKRKSKSAVHSNA